MQTSWIPKIRTLRNALAGSACLLAAGCGGGSNSTMTTPPPPVVAPSIAVQPSGQSVPMGLAATFSVEATGTPLQYQWKRNGSAIAGATASAYVTPPTSFADTGASFTVLISNSAGERESSPALLAVTARAPLAGDLRFRQVDAVTTVNGYGNAGVGWDTGLDGRMGMSFAPAIGTPLVVGPAGECAIPPVNNGVGCFWPFDEIPLPASAGFPDLVAAYSSDFYVDFQADLQAPSWLAIGSASPVSPASVIISLDLEPASNLFAVSWVQSNQRTGFELSIQTVTPSSLATTISQAGASARVVTAISCDGASVTFLSYGWQGDPSTMYESQVVMASPAGAPAAAAGLAAQGFIITATGSADAAGDIYLVGTRVQGDTTPRPFLAAETVAQGSEIFQQGYAIVGGVSNWPPGTSAANSTFVTLGER